MKDSGPVKFFFRRRRQSDRTITNDFFVNVENGCGSIQGLNPSTTRDDLLKIIHNQPCVSAVALGKFQKNNFISDYQNEIFFA